MAKRKNLQRRIEDDLRRELRLADKRFVKRFGRKPREADPLLWDETAAGDTPVPMDAEKLKREMIEIMCTAGIDPCKIYLFEKTGRILTEETYKALSKDDREEYDRVYDEYHEMALRAVVIPQ